MTSGTKQEKVKACARTCLDQGNGDTITLVGAFGSPAVPIQTYQADVPSQPRCDQPVQPEEQTVLGLALDVADSMLPRLPPSQGPGEDINNQWLLLALLIHSYANETYASEDIEGTVKGDPALLKVFKKAEVDEFALRRFRRAHRPWIEVCLAELMRRQSERVQLSRVGQSDRSNMEGKNESPFHLEARRRVDLAIMIDMAMSD